ncbi:hypothetical protein PsSCT_30590 [Pseudomonas sp. SCT]
MLTGFYKGLARLAEWERRTERRRIMGKRDTQRNHATLRAAEAWIDRGVAI